MGKISSFVFKRWKLLINVITLLALIVTLYIIRHDLITTFRDLLHVHAWALVLMIPIEMVNYHAQSKLYQRLFQMVGNKVTYKRMLKAALELTFVNHVFPSGGAAGISYFGLRVKDGEISGAKATMVQLMKLVLTFFSFEALVILSVFLLAIGGKVSNFTILVSGILSTLLIVGSGLFVYIIWDKERINPFLEFITKQINKILAKVHPTGKDVINMKQARGVFTDFHNTFTEMRSEPKKMRGPLVYALIMNITEIAAIYVVFVAFGHLVNPGAVILAYGIANIAGFISVLPGGEGIYEALMIAVLLTAGVSAKLSLPIIIMYRVINTLLQIPPGYYFYQKEISQHGTHVQAAGD